MEFQFTPQQIAHFQSHGWLAVEAFWTPQEIAAMRAELERLKAQGQLRNVATDGDSATISKNKANLQLCPMSPHSTLFRAMPFAPKVIQAVEQLIGGPLLLQLDQVFVKPGQSGAGTNWHQDNDYFGISETTTGTALWTAVHDATTENGAMKVISDAFHTPLPHTRDPESDHHVRCYPAESLAQSVELKAGGALFFNYGVPHATGPNLTDHERAGVALHFLTSDAHHTGNERLVKKPILTGPHATGGEAEYGERIAGSWKKEVEKALAEELIG